MLDEIGGKVVMVSDQQKAIDFYVNKLGLEKKADMQFGLVHWVELAPKNSKFTISLMEPNTNSMPPDQIEQAKKSIGTPTGIWFYSYTIQETYKELKSKGVDITEPQLQDWGGIMSTIKDQDENSYQLISSPETKEE